MKSRRLLSIAALALVWGLSSSSVHALVINEIMYHSDELDDKPFEWIELYNERIDPFDLSGFRLCNGVQYVFPPGTILKGYSYLVVASDVAAFSSKYDTTDIDVIGGWIGALENSGERLELCNAGGIPLLEVDYNDRGKWPVAADGTGHSLSLLDPYTDIDDPDNWTHSAERLGTPGAWNGHSREISGGPVSFNGMDGAGFIVDWLVLGPYTGSQCNLGNAALQADWLRGTSTPMEDDLIWRDGQSVQTNYSLARSTGLHNNSRSSTPRLELYESFSDTINFNDSVWPPDPDFVMAYAFVYVDNVTGSQLPVTLACASDDAISIMVNGDYRHVNDACRGVGGGGTIQDRADAILNPGKNLITVKVFENAGGWSFRLRIEERNTLRPITSPSAIQVTTDVDAGLRFDGSGTPILDPDDDGGDPGDPGDLSGKAPVVINEGAFRSGGDRWVELYNRTAGNIDLSGYYMTDEPSNLTKATIPNGTTIPGGGFVSFTDAELGLDFTVTDLRDRVFVALVDASGDKVVDAFNFEPEVDGFSEARLPDGDREFDDVADPTRDAPNSMTVNRDVVINEIMYHPIQENLEWEFVEIYNRGAQAVDLTGWSFTRGVNWNFADGTILPAGGYLVVARNPDLIRSTYGLSAGEVVGPPQTPEDLDAFGILRNGGERVTLKDELGRTVDTVRYHDGGQWPLWADGHGSSLELIDPLQDNRFAQAWDASDDSGKAETRTYSYIGRHGGGESELHLLLLTTGITVVDDVSILGGGIQTVDTPIIDQGETWRYFKGTEAPPADWNTLGFDDGSWLSGPTGIGYGDDDDATVLDDMRGSYVTVFCRKTFNVADPGSIDELTISVVVDDGFAAYLNGQEVASDNVGSRDFDAGALNAGEPHLVERDISQFKGVLRSGTNVLAVQVHNAGLSSSDLSFDPRLLDRTTTISGGSEQVVNGTFDSNTSGWMIEGTHIRSGRTTIDPIRGSGSLKIIATGKGDNKVNRIETPQANGFGLSTLNTGEDLQISFKARWVIGSHSLLTHGYQHAMAKSHFLAVPEDLGTPGRINGVTLRQNVRSGGNLGPVIGDVFQDPPVPGAGEDVTVRARVSDSDGVDTVRLRYSLDNPSSIATSVTMSPLGEGWYEGVIPGRPLGTKVVFYITASDSQGEDGRFPVEISERTHPLVLNPSSPSLDDRRYLIYRHDQERPTTPYHNYRFWMTDRHENELANRRRLSNDPVPGSFLFEARKIYYEAATRFSGSPFARGGFGASYRVKMPKDDLLHGLHREFGIDNHHGNGADARERISHYLFRNNQGGISVPYSDLQILVRWQLNDRATNTLEHVWVPDGDFVDVWWPDDGDGWLFEMDDRFIINDGGGRDGNTDARMLYPPPSPRSDGDGENKENYRWFLNPRTRQGLDDYSHLIDLARILDPGATSNAQFDDEIFEVCDVEQFLRYWAVRLNTDDWDQWGARRGKNCYLYRPVIDGRWRLIPWDLELTYGNTGSFNIPDSPASAFNPGSFAEVNRMFNRPAIKRMYYAVLAEMVDGPDAWFDSSRLAPFMNELAAIGMSNTDKGQPGGYIDQRADLIRPRIAPVLSDRIAFRITTNSGNPITTNDREIDLTGTGSVEVGSIVVVTNGDQGTAYPVSFPAMTSWRIDEVDLIPGVNELELQAFSLRGDFVASDTIEVTSTAADWPPPQITSLTPTEALPGETVEITGSELHNGLRVFFGGTESPNVVFDEFGATPGTIVAEVPDGSGDVQVTVRNLDGKVSNGLSFTFSEPPPEFVRGDSNYDTRVDLSDAVKTLLFLFAGDTLRCEEAADANGDGAVNLTDAVFTLEFLFRSGTRPPPPFPVPGPDDDGDAQGCNG